MDCESIHACNIFSESTQLYYDVALFDYVPRKSFGSFFACSSCLTA